MMGFWFGFLVGFTILGIIDMILAWHMSLVPAFLSLSLFRYLSYLFFLVISSLFNVLVFLFYYYVSSAFHVSTGRLVHEVLAVDIAVTIGHGEGYRHFFDLACYRSRTL